jgi:hypothetical protein
MFPSMQIHVHWENLMKKLIISKFQRLQILNQRVVRGILFIFFYYLANFLYSLSSFFSSRCMSHVQEVIMQNNMFSYP